MTGPWQPLPARGSGALASRADRERRMAGDGGDLQAIVEEIHAELEPRLRRRQAGRLHPAARPGRPAPLRHRRRHPRRHDARRRRRRRGLLDPEHLQGVPADAGARQARREPLDAGGARAVGRSVQLDRPARARAGPAAQPVHQRRRDRRHRPRARRPHAARGDRRDPAVPALPRRRRRRSAIDPAVARSERRPARATTRWRSSCGPTTG